MRITTKVGCMMVAVAVAASTVSATVIYHDPTIGYANQLAQESAFLAATSGITTIDFDDIASGTPFAGDEYAAQGILFSQPLGAQMYISLPNIAFTPRTEPNVLGLGGGSTPGIEDLQLDLLTPQHAVGLWAIDSEFTAPGFDEQIEFYNAALDLIAVIPLPHLGYSSGGPEGNFFFGVISADPIARVIMREAPNEPEQFETVAWDNIYFGVPEPATFALLLLGGAAVLRRR